MRAPRSRAFVLAGAVSLPIASAVVACTAGDELAYQSAVVANEAGTVEGGGAEDSGRIVGDSMAEASPRSGDGAVLSTAAPVACTGLAADCDPTAGMGCCLKNVPGNLGADNVCLEQVQHFGGTSCVAPGDVFLACLASDPDSTCCWSTEVNGTSSTRYRVACTGGVEACDPSAGGGACTTGGPCTAVTCKGLLVGYCGGGSAPCQP